MRQIAIEARIHMHIFQMNWMFKNGKRAPAHTGMYWKKRELSTGSNEAK